MRALARQTAGFLGISLAFTALSAAGAETLFLPLADVRAGMRGVGKTVFQGDRIEEFPVEVLGVLRNVAPKESLIIVRLSGGPLEHTGVMQGMSGSPVYIDGKLMGALAFAFPFAKDPIGAVRPIAEMLAAGGTAASPSVRPAPPSGNDLLAGLTPPKSIGGGMTEIATPLSFGGFTPATVEYFAPRFKALGLEPRQGSGFGGIVEDRMGDPAALHPGSMISVELMTGDFTAGADGTVTHIEDGKIYAFGHRFMAIGPTGLPFTRSEVIALLPNVNTSFKISTPRELMGVISQDRSTAISGVLGKRADLVPVDISMERGGTPLDRYRVNMVNDRYLAPMLLQMAMFSAIDATERTAGASSLSIRGQIELEGRASVPIANIYSGETNLPLAASLAPALPLAYIMQSGFDAVKVKRISLTVDSVDRHRQLQIEDVTASRKEVRPGESVDITTRLAGDNGAEIVRTFQYQVPVGAPPGTLFFSVSDGSQTSIGELRASYGTTPRTAEQMLDTVNKLRANDKAYGRVWRADPSYQAGGEEFPDPPASLALILGAGAALNPPLRNSKIAEFTIDGGGNMITGSKTVTVEVHV